MYVKPASSSPALARCSHHSSNPHHWATLEIYAYIHTYISTTSTTLPASKTLTYVHRRERDSRSTTSSTPQGHYTSYQGEPGSCWSSTLRCWDEPPNSTILMTYRVSKRSRSNWTPFSQLSASRSTTSSISYPPVPYYITHSNPVTAASFSRKYWTVDHSCSPLSLCAYTTGPTRPADWRALSFRRFGWGPASTDCVRLVPPPSAIGAVPCRISASESCRRHLRLADPTTTTISSTRDWHFFLLELGRQVTVSAG